MDAPVGAIQTKSVITLCILESPWLAECYFDSINSLLFEPIDVPGVRRMLFKPIDSWDMKKYAIRGLLSILSLVEKTRQTDALLAQNHNRETSGNHSKYKYPVLTKSINGIFRLKTPKLAQQYIKNEENALSEQIDVEGVRSLLLNSETPQETKDAALFGLLNVLIAMEDVKWKRTLRERQIHAEAVADLELDHQPPEAAAANAA